MVAGRGEVESTVGALRNLIADMPDDTIVRLSVAGYVGGNAGDSMDRFSDRVARWRLTPAGVLVLSDGN